MTSKQAKEYISKKIELLKKEGYKDPKQREAIALNMARHEGYNIPLPKGTQSMEHTK